MDMKKLFVVDNTGLRTLTLREGLRLFGYPENFKFDIDLDEFSDEIEPWIIDELKRVGCDTARSVIDLSDEELERRTDLEKETITEVKRVLNEEFKKE